MKTIIEVDIAGSKKEVKEFLDVMLLGVNFRIIEPSRPVEPSASGEDDFERFNNENGPMFMGEPVIDHKQKFRDFVEDEAGYFLYGDMAIAYQRKQLEALQSEIATLRERCKELESKQVSADPVAWINKDRTYVELSTKSTVYGSHTIPLYTAPQSLPEVKEE